MDDLAKRLAFIEEIDKLKGVIRRSKLINEERQENSAEHSWHVAMLAVVLAPLAPAGVDMDRVIRMLLVHDIVEIDVGDTFAYDQKGHEDKFERERGAAARLFGLLPPETGGGLKDLWIEFEECESSDATFASAIDRFLPILHNYRTNGYAWRQHGISRSQVLNRNAIIERGCPKLLPVLLQIIEDAVEKGMLKDA